MQQDKLREVELDEIEALLNLYTQLYDVSNLTSDQIASEIQSKYQVKCSGEEIFLLHESDIRDVWYEDRYYYENVLGIGV